MNGEAHNLYERLSSEREQYVDEFEECAALTIPHIFPENRGPYPTGLGTDLTEPYQSYGARLVNNIVSKLLLALFPINGKFFRLTVDEGALMQLRQFKEAETEVQENLADIEDIILDQFETSGIRTLLHAGLRQVVIGGNSLLHVPANGPPRVFRLDTYCVERDPRDNIQRIVLQTKVSPLMLPKEIAESVGSMKESVTSAGRERWVEVYTMVKRIPDGWVEWQEIAGNMVGKQVIHDVNRNPYIPLRMYKTDNESYGRGHVIENIGDLRAIDALSRSIQEGAAAAAQLKILVDPDGPTRLRKLATAGQGAYVPGREQDVHALQINKNADFAFVRQVVQDLKMDLGQAFLLHSSIPRDAERVTAEEIRLLAQDLEKGLGGTYSLLSADLQMPLVNIMMGNMQDAEKIPPLPEEVHPLIVTGLDAIGRGHDLERLDAFMAGAAQLFGPGVMQYFNVTDVLRQRATALGLDTETMLKSEEQLQKEQQQAQQASLAEKLGPETIKQFAPQMQEAAAAAGGAPTGP